MNCSCVLVCGQSLKVRDGSKEHLEKESKELPRQSQYFPLQRGEAAAPAAQPDAQRSVTETPS